MNKNIFLNNNLFVEQQLMNLDNSINIEKNKEDILLNKGDIIMLKLSIRKEIDKLIDELLENCFIRYNNTEKELCDNMLCKYTEYTKNEKERLVKELTLIQSIYDEIEGTNFKFDLNIEKGKLIPKINL